MSGLFGGPKSQGTTPPTIYNGVQMTLSTYAIPYSLVYGQTRVPGFLLQYEDFVVTPHTDSSGGGKGGGHNDGTSEYTYSAAVVLGVCEGPGSVSLVYVDKAQLLPTDPSLLLTVFPGASGQAPWSYMVTNHPTRALGYDHTVYVANGSLQLGNSASMPNLTFQCEGLQQYNPGLGMSDAEPSAIVMDYLTDPNHGADFSFPLNFTVWRTYCIAMGLFISPQETTQRTASDFLSEILQITNSDCIWSNGQLAVVPYGDETVTGFWGNFTPNLAPIYAFGDDDYVVANAGDEPIIVDRKAPDAVYNTLRCEFLDRTNQYNTAIAEATIDIDVLANGKRPMEDVTFHEITTAPVARLVAQLILNRQFFIRNTYQFTVRADYCLLEPMDVIEVNDSVLGLANKLVRITEVEHGPLPRRLVKITAEELPLGPGGSPVYNTELAQGYAANYGVSPGSVASPLIFNSPPSLVATQGDYEVMIAVAGQTDTWGGCNVYASLDDLNYEFVGVINGPSKYGTLNSALAASSTELDTTHTLSVTLLETDLVIPTSSVANADDYRTLMWVDGEIMAYANSALAGVGQYNLTYLHRALYGSTVNSHAAGTAFARLDTGIFRMPIDPGYIGKTMYFKFCSFNSYLQQVESIANVTAYAHTLAANSMGAIIPNSGASFIGRGVTIIGDTFFKANTGVAAWDSDAYSLEGYGAGVFIQWRDGGNGYFIMGLSTNPTLDTNFTSINFSFFCEAGAWSIKELGTFTGQAGSYVPGVDTFLIEYDGYNVYYYLSGVLKRTVAFSGTNLFADSSFFGPGAQALAVKFGPSAQVAGIVTGQIGTGAATSVTTGFTAGPITSTNTIVGQLATSVTLALPLPSDSNQTYIITATMEAMSNEPTDFGGQVTLQLGVDFHSFSGDTISYGSAAALSTSRKPMTLQQAVAAQAGVVSSATAVVFVNQSIAASRTATMWSIQIHCELVKR